MTLFLRLEFPQAHLPDSSLQNHHIFQTLRYRVIFIYLVELTETHIVNSRLRRHLISVKLPPPENYHAWVEEVREIAKVLESLADYRPKGRTKLTRCWEP